MVDRDCSRCCEGRGGAEGGGKRGRGEGEGEGSGGWRAMDGEGSPDSVDRNGRVEMRREEEIDASKGG
jgi:hypothetical protein